MQSGLEADVEEGVEVESEEEEDWIDSMMYGSFLSL